MAQKAKKEVSGTAYYTKHGLTKAVVIRFPPELKAKIKKVAQAEHLSLQNKIISLCERAVK